MPLVLLPPLLQFKRDSVQFNPVQFNSIQSQNNPEISSIPIQLNWARFRPDSRPGLMEAERPSPVPLGSDGMGSDQTAGGIPAQRFAQVPTFCLQLSLWGE